MPPDRQAESYAERASFSNEVTLSVVLQALAESLVWQFAGQPAVR